MARSDLGSSILLILFGAFVFYESWRMPRFESIGGTLHSAPGLVPGILGAILVLLGAIMLIRYLLHRHVLAADPSVPSAAATPGIADDQSAQIEAPRSGAMLAGSARGSDPSVPAGAAAGTAAGTAAADIIAVDPTAGTAPSTARMLWTLVFSTIFALGLVGRVPFWLAVFAFVFVFIAWFERPAYKDARTTITRLVIAAAIAGAAAFAVPFVFERVFLVNLP